MVDGNYHCERSEAIQGVACRSGLPRRLRLLAMTREHRDITSAAKQSRASLAALACFVAFAPRNDGGFPCQQD